MTSDEVNYKQEKFWDFLRIPSSSRGKFNANKTEQTESDKKWLQKAILCADDKLSVK